MIAQLLSENDTLMTALLVLQVMFKLQMEWKLIQYIHLPSVYSLTDSSVRIMLLYIPFDASPRVPGFFKNTCTMYDNDKSVVD